MLADGEHFLSVSNLISARNDHQRHERDHDLTHQQLLLLPLKFYQQKLNFYQPLGGLNLQRYALRERQLHQHGIGYLDYLVKE